MLNDNDFHYNCKNILILCNLKYLFIYIYKMI